MKTLAWSHEKNERLKIERGVSFEKVVLQIAKGEILDILENPNRERYPNQRIFIVKLGDYAYLVPFVESEDLIFLKTIIPSRKATKDYLKGIGHE
jgi:hypothetical protein